MNDTELLQCIARSVHQAAYRRLAVRVGPFLALIDTESDLVWFSYAVPVASLGAASDQADLEHLKSLFASYQRPLRFEFCLELWPTLPALLEEAGLHCEARQPLLLCTPEEAHYITAPEVEIQLLQATDSDAHLAALLQVQSGGFDARDDPPPAALHDIERLRQELMDDHLRGGVALVEGQVTGSGLLIVAGAIAELAGVATLPRWRRRGVATTLTSALVAYHFARQGSIVWLSAADNGAQSIYERVGFRLVGTQLNYGQISVF